MRKPSAPDDILVTLLSRAIEIGADELEVQYQDRQDWVCALKGGSGLSIASFPSNSPESVALRRQLMAIGKRGKTIETCEGACRVTVSTYEDFGEPAFRARLRKA